MQTPCQLLASLALLGACAVSSCVTPDDMPSVAEELPARYPGVDEALWPYFAAYEEEGSLRGVSVDLSALDVSADLVDTLDSGVAGQCTFDPRRPNELVVDSTTFGIVSERFREYIVFHELGHCERLRRHREVADAEGVCVSIMASGVGECRDNYTPASREALLDELFDESFYGEWP